MRTWLVAGAWTLSWMAACSTQGASDDDGSGGSRPPGPTELCEESCIPKHPEGESAYFALRECLLCRACANICASAVTGLCEPQPDLDGCSATATSCEQCIASPCALQQQADTTFVGICAPEGNACIQTPGCVPLNNCVSQCVGNAPTTGSGGAGGQP